MDASVAVEAGSRIGNVDVDAIFLQKFGDPFSGGFAGEIAPGLALCGREFDLQAGLGEGSGQFDAEQAAANNDGLAASARMLSAFASSLVDRVAEAFCIFKRAQIEEIGEIDAGYVERARAAADGDQEIIEGNFLAVA